MTEVLICLFPDSETASAEYSDAGKIFCSKERDPLHKVTLPLRGEDWFENKFKKHFFLLFRFSNSLTNKLENQSQGWSEKLQGKTKKSKFNCLHTLPLKALILPQCRGRGWKEKSHSRPRVELKVFRSDRLAQFRGSFYFRVKNISRARLPVAPTVISSLASATNAVFSIRNQNQMKKPLRLKTTTSNASESGRKSFFSEIFFWWKWWNLSHIRNFCSEQFWKKVITEIRFWLSPQTASILRRMAAYSNLTTSEKILPFQPRCWR